MSESQTLPPEQPTILSFTGPDAVRFLNGQITQNVSDLGNNALSACVTDAKGRLQFFIKIFAGSETDSIWISCPQNQSEGLRDRLERYLIADEVEIDELTNHWTLIHSSASNPDSSFSRNAKGPFGDGHDLWWKLDDIPDGKSISTDHAERLRIAARIPVWGSELNADLLPPEAGLDQYAISYQKGCYIGQEVLSRIKTAGKLNRRLAAFRIDAPANAGDALVIADREIGKLTSYITADPTSNDPNALGYLSKKGFDASKFQVIDSTGAVQGTATFHTWA